MGYLARGISRVGGERVISLLGALYVALALGWAFSEASDGAQLGDALISVVLVGGPGLVLVYWGRRLQRADVDPELYPTVASWCLGGIAVMLGVLALYHLQPTDSLTNPAESALILTALASVAGLGVGVHDARAKTRAREAERHSHELERQNERLESFAGMLAHELRNPLTIAQIYHPQEQPRNEDPARQVETALDRIEEMIDVLLITARGPNASVEPEPVALADVAADAWDDASTQLARDSAKTTSDSARTTGGPSRTTDGTSGTTDDSTQRADDPAQPSNDPARHSNDPAQPTNESAPTVDDPTRTTDRQTSTPGLGVETDRTIMADPVHVEHLLRNLFRNSFEHGDDAVTVRVGDLPSGFYVEDDGPGIPEDVREDVVEAGFTTKPDGIGLGLTFVAQLAEMYDWDYSIAESEIGGARFEFTNVDRASTPEEPQRH